MNENRSTFFEETKGSEAPTSNDRVTVLLTIGLGILFSILLGVHALALWSVRSDPTPVVLWMSGVAIYIVSVYRTLQACKRGELG
jgi:hypothetical protein